MPANKTTTARGRAGLGIVASLTLAFAGLAVLAAVAGSASSWLSMQSARIATDLGAKVLPTVTASLNFAQNNAILVSEAPSLASRPDAGSLDQQATRLAGMLSEQSKRLAALRDLGADATALDSLQKRNTELGPKIDDLKALASDRLAIRAQIQKTVAQALSDYQDLMDFVRPLQEATQTAVDGEIAALKESAGSGPDAKQQIAQLDQDYRTLHVAMDIQASSNLAFGMLSAAATATDESATNIKFQYDWAEVYMGKALKAFVGSQDAERLQKLVDALLKSGSGNDSVFLLRTREVDLDGKISVTLNDLVNASAKLTDEVQALVQAQESAAHGAVAQSGAVTKQTVLVNAVTSGAVMIAALLIALLYVRRSVGRRLRTLSNIMTALAGGNRAVTVDVSGRDEITTMAEAVQVFRQGLITNDELSAEAARMAKEREAARDLADRERTAAAACQATVVNSLAGGLAALAHGDLTHDLAQPFAAEYETLRRDFNATVAQLRATMEQIVGNAETLRSGTTEIAGAADDLSRRTENQAASLEQTAAALGEVTSAIRKTAEGAVHARDVVGSAKKQAETSGAVMQDAIAAMSAIEDSSRKIGQIIGVVDEIAFQTNLLALNAGVEAARAGEAGRGFAVVASEVRALAQRSADAAKEIKTLVASSKTQVSHGVELVGQSGNALRGILAKVAEINTDVSEIARAANEQILGLDQVNVAVNQMDQVTQQNAAMVEETTAASHHLAREIETLVTLIGRFDVGAGRSVGASPVKAKAGRHGQPPAMSQRTPRGGAVRKVAPSPRVEESWTEF